MKTNKKLGHASLGFAMGAVACGLRARKPLRRVRRPGTFARAVAFLVALL